MKLSEFYRTLQEYVLKNDKDNKKWFDFYRDRKFYGEVVKIGALLLRELGAAVGNEEDVQAAIKKAFNSSTQLHVNALYHNDRRVCISATTTPIKTNIPDDYFTGDVSEKDFRALIEKGYGISFQTLLHTCLNDIKIKNFEFDRIVSGASEECKEAVELTKLSFSSAG